MISIALNCTCTANNLFCFHKFITYICQPSYKNRIASILTWKINCLPLSARARFDKTKIYLFSILFYLYFAHFVNEQFNFCRWHKKFSLLYFLFYTTFHHLFKFWNVKKGYLWSSWVRDICILNNNVFHWKSYPFMLLFKSEIFSAVKIIPCRIICTQYFNVMHTF